MNEPITIAKIRKATTIKVPAGGWVILVSPGQVFTDHANLRRELAQSLPTHEEFETVIVGRINESFTPLKFRTAKDQESHAEELKRNDEAMAQSNRDALERQKKIDSEINEANEKAHKETVAKLNASHDAIRNPKK